MSTIVQTKSAKHDAHELGLQTVSDKDGVAREQSQTTSAKPDAHERGLQSWPEKDGGVSGKSQTELGKDAPAREQLQTASALDDYDARVLLMHRAFNEIAKICYQADYTLDADDWELLDGARLDSLPYEQLRAALVHAYRQIKRKAQAAQSVEVANHSRLRR